MFESIGNFFKKFVKPENKELRSKDDAKERLHLVLMQDRANVSADFLELMKQEIIDVIKKYIVVDENSIDVRLTNQPNEDGTNGAPALYANIPIVNIKNDMKASKIKEFEGVNFDKKLEESEKETEKEEKQKKEEVQEKSIEPEVKEEKKEEKSNDTDSKENKKDNKNDKKDNKSNDNKKEKEENKKEQDEDDEEDDGADVTFDDLLKAAQEENKKKVNKG